MNWFLDLPKLASVISDGGSFNQPRIVTLSSLILNDWMMNRYSESWSGWTSWFIKICIIAVCDK